ncbi:MAG: farnesyl diphosphate synthase [Lachnospiraceae bacterium]|nr:polyprenyl synthetase family protein [Lachnoclostridium sp.]MDD7521886.1 polyprenyl synthetase family protein [Lachnoclostridium sp.]MDY2598464.1 farnesyl diphosphate synthase [Lachnospiraceae bacterium]
MEQLKEKVNDIENILVKYMPSKEGYQKVIFEAMEYALMAGGKRLRPMFMNEVYLMCGGSDRDLIEPFMAAIEMIHTYSLIHDDLPAMDDDDYRRGRKTTHIVYGEDMGILAGDALLNYAYETCMKAFGCGYPERAAKALEVLTKKAGVYGMVGGQVVDVKMNGRVPDMDMLLFIYRLKTGALLEASFMVGGILAGADDKTVEQLGEIALNVGIAFQIQDDILDVTSTTMELGKPVNSDEKNNKTTYVQFLGMDRAKEDVKNYSHKASELLHQLDTTGDKEFVEKLIDSLINRTK